MKLLYFILIDSIRYNAGDALVCSHRCVLQARPVPDGSGDGPRSPLVVNILAVQISIVYHR